MADKNSKAQLDESYRIYSKYASIAFDDLIGAHINNAQKVTMIVNDLDVALHNGTYTKNEIVKFKMLLLKMLKDNLALEKGDEGLEIIV